MNTHIKRRKDKLAKLFPRLGERAGVPHIQYNPDTTWISLRSGAPLPGHLSDQISILSIGDSVKLTQQ